MRRPHRKVEFEEVPSHFGFGLSSESNPDLDKTYRFFNMRVKSRLHDRNTAIQGIKFSIGDKLATNNDNFCLENDAWCVISVMYAHRYLWLDEDDLKKALNHIFCFSEKATANLTKLSLTSSYMRYMRFYRADIVMFYELDPYFKWITSADTT